MRTERDDAKSGPKTDECDHQQHDETDNISILEILKTEKSLLATL